MYKLKDAVDLHFTFNGKKIDYLQDIEFKKDTFKEEYAGSWDTNGLVFGAECINTKELKDTIDEQNINNIIGEIDYLIKIEDVHYKVKIGNIPGKYLIINGQFVVQDIIHEYCRNIIEDLYRLGCRFDTDEVYDFQKYLT